MSNPDRTRQREHWQAIAEQLGLAPEPEEAAAPAPEANAPPPRNEEKRTAEPPTPEPANAPARRGRRGRSAAVMEEPAPPKESDQVPTGEDAQVEADAEPAGAPKERPASRR